MIFLLNAFTAAFDGNGTLCYGHTSPLSANESAVACTGYAASALREVQQEVDVDSPPAWGVSLFPSFCFFRFFVFRSRVSFLLSSVRSLSPL